LARVANQMAQAFMRDALMRDALMREVHRAELTASDAAEEVGNTFERAATFGYLTARVSGASCRRRRHALFAYRNKP
jgi:hypothetical protein